jgi:hypothetical protein
MAEPVHRKNTPGGGKHYLHPRTNERFDSVTTVLDISDKAGLKQWAANLAAEMALELLPQLTASMIEPLCKNTYNRCYQKHGKENSCERCPCGKCTDCLVRRIKFKHFAESSRRAQEGSETHEAIDAWATMGGIQINLRDEVKPYFNTFLKFAKDYGLRPGAYDPDDPTGGSWEANEVTVINREYMYAGTSDGAFWLLPRTSLAREKLALINRPRGAKVRFDWKTREKPDERLYTDMPLQGAAYDRAEAVLLPDGSEHPNIQADACALVQLRPPSKDHPDGDYTFKLMVTDDETFAAFVHCLHLFRWITGPGQKAFDEDPAVLGLTAEMPLVAQFLNATGAIEVGEVVELPDPWAEESSQPNPQNVPPTGLMDPWAEEFGDGPLVHAGASSPWPTDEQIAAVKTENATPPRKTAAKRAPAKAGGTTAGERAANREKIKNDRIAAKVEAQTAPAQLAHDSGGGHGAILDSLRGFTPGPANQSLYNDEIPF